MADIDEIDLGALGLVIVERVGVVDDKVVFDMEMVVVLDLAHVE